MYGSLDKFLDGNTDLKSIIGYDFKNESSVSAVFNEKASINKFIAYSTKDEHLDCDNSNGSCKLTDDIYKTLWNWSFEERNSVCESLNMKLNVNWSRYGSDTMNSFRTIYLQAKKLSKDDEEKVNSTFLIQRFSTLTHTLGNFTLVPFKLDASDDKSFNQYRGFNSGKYFVYDFFDLSLKLIKEKIGDEAFRRYIDVFYLNMYVDESYNIKPLFKRHKKFLKQDKLDLSKPEEFLPKTELELKEYLLNVNDNIEARGRLMALKLIELKGKNDIEIKLPEKSKKKNLFDKLAEFDKLSLILFFLFFVLLSAYSVSNMVSGVGGIGNAYAQFGFIEVTKELLKVFNFELIIATLVMTVILRGIIWRILTLFWRCPHCRKKFAFKKLYTEETGTKAISVKVVNEEKNANGNVTRTSEQYIPGTRHYYETIHKCSKCGYERYKYHSTDRAHV